MKWLYKLEYKFGRRYIPRLMMYIVIGMALVFVVDYAGLVAGFNLSSWLALDRAAIFNWQLWRLVTFIFIPESGNPFFLLISLYFYYMMGNLLENYWGGFRLNLYYLFGIVGAILSMLLVGYGTNAYLNLSLFLAFATIAGDMQVRLFFILPIKAKWLALFYAGFMALQIVFAIIANPAQGLRSLVSLAFSLLNYLLFFGPTLLESIRNWMHIAKNRRNWRRK